MNSEFIAFLGDSLQLWKVEGEVTPGSAPVVAVIRAHYRVIAVERNDDDDAPWRWFVRWQDNGAERLRPCASIPGLLNALRRALNVERGNAVRIARAAPP